MSLVGSPARIDVTVGLSKMTLDVIGLAGRSPDMVLSLALAERCSPTGFDYEFQALADKPNELNQAFSTMFNAISKISVQVDVALRYAIPILDCIVRTLVPMCSPDHQI